MSISAPKILYPSNGQDYITDGVTQTLSGTTAASSSKIKVNGSVTGVIYTEGETAWSWTGNLSLGVNTYSVTAIEKTTGDVSPAATIAITLINQDMSITISQPTGVRLRRYQDRIDIINVKNPESNVIGYNYYVSYQSGGVNNIYSKINQIYVTDSSFYEDTSKILTQTTDQAGDLNTTGTAIKVTTTTEEITRTHYYSTSLTKDIFDALVASGSFPNISFNEDTPLFFVVTAVLYDPISSQVTESSYSAELQGSPITITTGITDLPGRTQTDIILTYSREILAGNPGADTKPGTVVRDIIDPISEETARVYVIQDFMARSLSVSALLDFDDSNGDGVSDPVNESIKNRALQVALGFTDPTAVQTLINDQFDKLGSNVNVIRRGAVSSTGSVVFYTATAPIRDMSVLEGSTVSTLGDLDSGIPAQNYRVLASKTMAYADRETYYNRQTSRYELIVDVSAINPGTAGNTGSYTIKTANGSVDPAFLLENPNPISFGEDKESNQEMSARIQLAFFADTGTAGGYAKVAISVPTVRGVRVEKAGDSLMLRDYDPIRKEHIGGKVDIYIQGNRTQEVIDQVAFSYQSIQATEGTQSGETFTIVSAVSYQFKSQNPRVSSHTPIFEVSRVYNSTRAAAYDIVNYQIIGSGDTIDLNELSPLNVSIGLSATDIIRVDYKFRSSDTYILQHQPVKEIISVIGALSGTLTSDNYDLVKLQDPLENGGSTIASDGIRIKFANNLLLTEFQTITDESHVILLDVDESLDNIGADIPSIVITNEAKTVIYVKDVDYTVNPGTETVATTVKMIETGSIIPGQAILISYTSMENFTIRYSTNELLTTVQTQMNAMKHACADVIVKQAVENKIDFSFTVVPKPGVTNQSLLGSAIQTAVANYVSQQGVGVSVAQSEIVHIINGINDVDYVVLPFIRMVKADGSFIVRDDIGTPSFEIFNSGIVPAYITVAAVLTYSTIDGGGSENLFRGIFENNMPLVLQSDPLYVSQGPGRGYIRGDGRIIVSTIDGELPDIKKYQVAYYVFGETGSKDIEVNSLEYLSVGSFNVKFDTPRVNTKQSF